MAIDQELLDILCCPVTKTELKLLSDERIAKLNKEISGGKIKYHDGKTVDKPLDSALITIDEKTIYRVDEEIPIMLVEMSIATEQFTADIL